MTIIYKFLAPGGDQKGPEAIGANLRVQVDLDVRDRALRAYL